MKTLKFLSNKWFFICILIAILILWMMLDLPSSYNPPPQPTMYEILTDRTQYYFKELIAYNSQIYSVMLDEVESDLNGFYLIISLVGLAVIILTLQIIAAITRLPIGYLAYPGKFLVVKRSKVAQIQLTPTEKGEQQ